MSLNLPANFRRANSDKYCLQDIKMFCLWTRYVVIFIKRPPTGGTGKLFLSNNIHALTSYNLGKFDWIGMQAKKEKKKKPLTRPCYESIPSAWRSGTNSSINDTYCFPATTKTLQRIDASWWHVAKMNPSPGLLSFSSKWLEREHKLCYGKSRQTCIEELLFFLMHKLV